METHRHRELKRVGAAWLVARGYLAVATEVSAPIPRFRVDVAGWTDRVVVTGAEAPERCEPRAAIIECKQARSDFIRDSRRRDRLLRLRSLLERRCAFLEETHVRHHEPHLRASGTSLFPELERWDYDQSSLGSYRTSVERLRRIEGQLYRETKFCTMARYRVADELFLLAPPRVATRRELPWGWGLLLCPEGLLRGRPRPFGELVEMFTESPDMLTRSPAPEHATTGRFRDRFLRNIAVASTRSALMREEVGSRQLMLPGLASSAGPRTIPASL